MGQLKPPNSGGTIYGVLDEIMNYDVTASPDPQHQFKINGGVMMMINNNSVTSYGVINCAAGIRCNSPSSSFYVGGGNAFDSTAITNPKFLACCLVRE